MSLQASRTQTIRTSVHLKGVNFHVDRGEAVAIIGENGAGKTTLLKVCARLLAPDAGSVRRHGRIGYCPQEPGVVDLLTAEQHVLLFGAAAGLSRSQARTTGMALLTRSASPRGRTPWPDLSGGTRQ